MPALASDVGRIETIGDAVAFGDVSTVKLTSPIVGVAGTPSGGGYWLVGSDGGVFSFGDAPYAGTAAGGDVAASYVGLLPSADGAGYSLIDSLGNASAYGSSTIDTGGQCDPDPVVAVSAATRYGALLVRSRIAVPSGRVSAVSASSESSWLDVVLDHAQACQKPAEVPPPMSLPLDGLRVTSRFGPRTHPVWKVRQMHTGIDAVGGGVTLGATVKAAATGEVIAVLNTSAYGRAVVVDHGARIATVYAHFDSVDVAVGDVVAVGQRLGSAGSTGFATGPHLHFEIRVEGGPVDPTAALGL